MPNPPSGPPAGGNAAPGFPNPSPLTRILPCPDEPSAARAAASAVLDAVRASRSPRLAVALSGGRIAPRLYAALLDGARHGETPLAAADFFWADERCVPPDHADSNYAAALALLLAPLGVPAERIHRLAGELDPAMAARLAVEDWHRWRQVRGGPEAGPDVVILGVGEDGHVASLFPGNLAADLAAPEPFRSVIGPKPPPSRLTVGYPMLWEAGEVVVLATGAGKEPVVSSSLGGGLDTPLARVVFGRATRGRGTTVVTAFPAVQGGR